MRNNTRFYTEGIEYSVTRTKRKKTSQITVDATGIEVKTPITKKDSEIRRMVLKKKDWIVRKQLEFSNTPKDVTVSIKRKPRYLERRAWQLASKIGIMPTGIRIKTMKSRWGSCTKDGIINLNIALTKTPIRATDYVIVHELCHLKIRDHAKDYWKLVKKFIPDYKRQKEWLDLNQKSILN